MLTDTPLAKVYSRLANRNRAIDQLLDSNMSEKEKLNAMAHYIAFGTLTIAKNEPKGHWVESGAAIWSCDLILTGKTVRLRDGTEHKISTELLISYVTLGDPPMVVYQNTSLKASTTNRDIVAYYEDSA